MKTFLTVIAACIVAVPAIALACGDMGSQAQANMSMSTPAAPAAVKTLTVPELASLNAAKKVTVFDVNGAETRQKKGVIPGAKLLTTSSQYAASELPAAHDTALVFYCAGVRCNASHQAAARATSFGYTNVSVLPDGISGWVAAGQRTEKVSAPRS
jgi:rhodanese-related sulfurtransferase